MKYSCHSEYGSIHSIAIKSVSDAFLTPQKLEQEWAELNYLALPDFERARTEYADFQDLLSQSATQVLHFPKDAHLSLDSMYCRDASIATDHGMVLCRMGKKERASEPLAQAMFFEKNEIKILGEISAPGTLEGGDVAWLTPTILAVGHSYRTNAEGIRQLELLLKPFGITVLEVALPHYKGPTDVFHLMSIISPIDRDLAVVFSPLMPIMFRNRLLAMGYTLVEVPEDEFESMGGNVLALAPRKCLMIEGNPKTKKALLQAGCEVLTYKGEEISSKGGGGPTCLTRPMYRG